MTQHPRNFEAASCGLRPASSRARLLLLVTLLACACQAESHALLATNPPADNNNSAPGLTATAPRRHEQEPLPPSPPSSFLFTEPREAGRVGYSASLGSSRFMIWGASAAGQMPKGLAVSPDNRWLFCSNMGVEGEKTLSVYRSDPLSLERHVDLPGKAIELAVSANGQKLFLTNSKAWGALQTFSVEGLKLEHEIAVPGFPKWMQLAPSSNALYATLWALDGVSRVTWSDNSGEPWQVSTLRTGKGTYSRHASKDKNPRGMALSQDGKTLYVANNADESLSLIDTATFKERNRIRIGYAPRHIVTNRQHSLFISLTGNDSVLEFDTQSESAVRELLVGKRPKTIALSHDERFLYVGNFVDNSLSILALPGGERVDLPLDLHKVSGLAVRADDRFIYVTGFCTGDVWAIERLDAGTSPTLPLGSDRDNQPCFTCPSSFEGCPYYEGPL